MVGKKVVMGVTGLIGIGFVILYSLGNLLVFRGPTAINSYSHFLKSTGELLWALRIVLIVAVNARDRGRAANIAKPRRPPARLQQPNRRSRPSRTNMRCGGVFLLVFIGSTSPLHDWNHQPPVYSRRGCVCERGCQLAHWWLPLLWAAWWLSDAPLHGAWSSVKHRRVSHRRSHCIERSPS